MRPRQLRPHHALFALFCALAMVLTVGDPSPSWAQHNDAGPPPPRDRENWRGDACGGCGVDMGGGFSGPSNEGRACAPSCLTARIGFGGHSDLMPIGLDGERTDPGQPAGAGGAPGGGSGGTGSAGGGAGERPPPPPPTLDEALATCPSPAEPVLGRNPDAEGLTGLETYLWAEPQGAQSSGGRVRGHPVGCTLTPVRWTWTSGDGATYTRDRPGGPHPDNPAGHVYETKGDYTMRLTVHWRANTSAGAATLTRTTQRAYHVFEVRSVRTG